MTDFKEDYEKRLRRLCGVTDDSLKVIEDSKIVYGGYCETCRYEDKYIRIRVWNEDKTAFAGEERLFFDMGELIRELDKIDPREL